jgi:hypothetical protein
LEFTNSKLHFNILYRTVFNAHFGMYFMQKLQVKLSTSDGVGVSRKGINNECAGVCVRRCVRVHAEERLTSQKEG